MWYMDGFVYMCVFILTVWCVAKCVAVWCGVLQCGVVCKVRGNDMTTLSL